MVKWYIYICSTFPNKDHFKISEPHLTDQGVDEIDVYFWKLQDLDNVTLASKSESTTLSDALILFDGVLEQSPALVQKLGPNSPLVEKRNFEEATSKLQHGEESTLQGVKQRSIEHLQLLEPTD